MITSTNRNLALAEAVVAQVPAFSAIRDDLTAFFAASAESAIAIPDRILEARRAATAEVWAGGAAQWSSRVRGISALMNLAARDPASTHALMDTFAADFTDATLGRGLDASAVIFPGHLVLDGALLEGALRLDGAQIAGSFSARKALVRHEVSADSARFVGPVVLDGLEVTRSARFSASHFMSDVSIDEAIFHKDLWLRHSDFAGHVMMRGADLRHDVSLGACRYARTAQFNGTRFRDTCSFEDANFQGHLSLDNCTFEKLLRLDRIKLLGGASWHGAGFLGEVKPSLAILGTAPGPQPLVDRLHRAFGNG